MWKMLYFVTVVGVFLQAVNGQKWDITKLEQCPCANNVIETFLESVAKSALEDGNGQKLRLRLWQLNNDDCTANVLDKSPKPGKIEISMKYRGSVDTEEQGKDEDVQDKHKSDDQAEQQQRVDDEGQDRNEDTQIQHRIETPGNQQGEDIGQQQGPGDIEQDQAAEVIGLLQAVDTALQQFQQSMATEQQQQDVDAKQEQAGEDTEQEQAGEDTKEEQAGEDTEQKQAGEGTEQEQQAGVDTAQEQSELSSNSQGDKDYSTEFSFTVDVNTGKLSESTDSMTKRRRRRREVMPFDTVTIKIAINFDKKPNSDQIKAMIRKGLNDYWLSMAFCILDVKQ